jgi:hypothetical protein
MKLSFCGQQGVDELMRILETLREKNNTSVGGQ